MSKRAHRHDVLAFNTKVAVALTAVKAEMTLASGRAFRRGSQPGRAVQVLASGSGGRGNWSWRPQQDHRAALGRENVTREDLGVDAGERFLRSGSTDFRLQGLENKAECLGTPMQIVDYSRSVTRLVGRGLGPT